MVQINNVSESVLDEIAQQDSSANIDNALRTIWTNRDHPLHLATDKTIAKELKIFLHMVQWKRIRWGILGAPTRKRLYKEFKNTVDQSSMMAVKSRRIINARYRKRISKVKRRISNSLVV